ncbi:hypothetical protein B0H14DRAFT_2283987, partial [Mycena olivaceomarginata]
SDPDVAGVGVRTAIYAQTLMSFVLAVWALWDNEVSSYELAAVETQSINILITAFAVLVSAIIQAATLGHTNFVAVIVLNLTWMNNTNAFIFNLLYFRRKSQSGMPMQFSSW